MKLKYPFVICLILLSNVLVPVLNHDSSGIEQGAGNAAIQGAQFYEHSVENDFEIYFK
jgi:hypothetical protein